MHSLLLLKSYGMQLSSGIADDRWHECDYFRDDLEEKCGHSRCRDEPWSSYYTEGEPQCQVMEDDAEEYPCPSMGGTGTNSSAAHHHWAVHATNCVLRTTFKTGTCNYMGEVSITLAIMFNSSA